MESYNGYTPTDILKAITLKILEKLQRDYTPAQFKSFAIKLLNVVMECSMEHTAEAQEELGSEDYARYSELFRTVAPKLAETTDEEEYKSAIIDLVSIVFDYLIDCAKKWNLDEAVNKYLLEKEESHGTDAADAEC